MDGDKLVLMANRIGEFFEAMADRREAVAGVAQHLQRFWAPPMRQALLVHVDQAGGSGLSAIVLEAIRSHRALLG